MSKFYILAGISSEFDPEYTFVTSWLIPPIALACLRILLSIYCFTTLFYSFGWFATHIVTFHLQDVSEPEYSFSLGSEAIGQSFSYFTYLSYWGLAFYFLVSGIHTIVYAIKHDTWLHRAPRPLQVLHSVFYTSAICVPLLVSSVFWLTMWIGPWYIHDFDAWSNISIHALNSVFALMEILLPPTQPAPWLHLGVLLIIMSLYLGLAYLTHFTQNIYVYEWLDPRFGVEKILAHILGITMGMVVIFVCVRGLVLFRNHLLTSRSQNGEQRRQSTRLWHISSPQCQYDDVEKALLFPIYSQAVSETVTQPRPTQPRMRETWYNQHASVRNFSRVNSFSFEPLRPPIPF